MLTKPSLLLSIFLFAGRPAHAALDIVLDFDTFPNQFFAPGIVTDGVDGQTRRDVVERAARQWEVRIGDTLDAIDVSEVGPWTGQLYNPNANNASVVNVQNLSLAEGQVIIFVGAANLGGTLGQATYNWILSASSPEAYESITRRGETGIINGFSFDFGGINGDDTDFAPWGGMMRYNPNPVVAAAPSIDLRWYYGGSIADIPDDTATTRYYDFYSVVMHEIGHVLGFGTSDSFRKYIGPPNATSSGRNVFLGPRASLVNGQSNPELEGAQNTEYYRFIESEPHYVYGLQADTTQRVLMGAATPSGTRKGLTHLDVMAMVDIGWHLRKRRPVFLEVQPFPSFYPVPIHTVIQNRTAPAQRPLLHSIGPDIQQLAAPVRIKTTRSPAATNVRKTVTGR